MALQRGAASNSQLRWIDVTPDCDEASGPGARSSHGMSVVDNAMYVFGGEKVPRIPIDSSVWRLQLPTNINVPQIQEWQRVSASGDIPVPRVAHAQAAVGSFIYIFGGRLGISESETAINDFYRFNTLSGEWEQMEGTPTATARSFHRMIAGGPTTLFVFGGCGEAGRLADLHRVDLDPNGSPSATWTNLGSPHDVKGRGGPGLYISEDGERIIVIGGFTGAESSDIHIYNIASHTWTTVDPATSKFRPRSVFAGATWRGRGLVAFGGEVSPSDQGHEGAGGFERDTLLFDDATGAVSLVDASPAPPARGWGGADACPVGVALYGGLAGSDEDPRRLSDVWVLGVA